MFLPDGIHEVRVIAPREEAVNERNQVCVNTGFFCFVLLCFSGLEEV